MSYIEEQEKIRKKAIKYISKHGEQDAYDFATWILDRLQGNGFCIWQSYTVDDIELNDGRRPTKERMQELSDNLQSFDCIS